MRVTHVLTDAEHEILADTVIFSSSGVARDALYYALQTAAPGLELKLIGDAVAPRHLRHAMVDGARVGREL